MPVYTSPNGSISLLIRRDDADRAAMGGDSLRAVMRVPYVRKQLERINTATLQQELRSYQYWSTWAIRIETEHNQQRLLWVAANEVANERVT